jgi:hypothetical protein
LDSSANPANVLTPLFSGLAVTSKFINIQLAHISNDGLKEKLHLQAVYYVCQTKLYIVKPLKNMAKLISSLAMLKTGKYKTRFKNFLLL